MENIEIERFEEPKVDVFKVTGEYVGYFNNQHEFNKFRIKMMEHNATKNYYFMWNDIKITVYENGDMSDFPIGLYDQARIDLLKILQLSKR